MRSTHKKTQAGMTLVETVVAVAVLTIAITGPMMLAYQSIKTSRDARNELIATHLAAEGIEAVANIRSNNSADDLSASGDQWLTNILPACSIGCVFDIALTSPVNVWNAAALTACPGGNCATVSRLFYNNSTGLYRQNTAVSFTAPWQSSPFRRVIKVTLSGSTPYQAVVEVTVYFNRANGGEGKVMLTQELYNWFPSVS